MLFPVVTAVVGAALVCSAQAQVTIYVDGAFSGQGTGTAAAPYATVQEGLDHHGLQSQDTVLVAPGQYQEALTFPAAGASLVSLEGPSQTRLLAPPGAPVHVAGTLGLSATFAIDGFTVVGNGSDIGLDARFFSTTFIKRSVWREHGIALRNDASLFLENCTISDNALGLEHFGWAHGGAFTVVEDSIFWSNTTDIDGEELHMELFISNTLRGIDPRFHGPSDLHLLADSPAIDAGNPGETDPDGTRRDAGAFPFDPSWPLGEATCPGVLNSSGQVTRVSVSGSASITAGSLVVHGHRLPALEFALLFRGVEAADVPLGQGTLCIGGSLVRMGVQRADGLGTLNYPVDLAATTLMAGDSAYFQIWHRDVLGPDFFALSGAVRIHVQP